jgi:hypothetical protein
MIVEMVFMECLMVLALLVVVAEAFHFSSNRQFPWYGQYHRHHGSCLQQHKKVQHSNLHRNQYPLRAQKSDDPGVVPVEDGVSLASLENVEDVGLFLRNSVMKWLDDEYIPQDIHRVLGEAVQQVYLSKHTAGVTDLGEMMMSVGTALEGMDMKESFVNAWDVANKVSDLLMLKLDRELCACMGDMSAFATSSSSSVSGDSDASSGTSSSSSSAAISVSESSTPSGTTSTSTTTTTTTISGSGSSGSSSQRLTVSLRIKTRQRVYKPIPAVAVDAALLARTAKDLRTEFARYKLLRDFIEGGC